MQAGQPRFDAGTQVAHPAAADPRAQAGAEVGRARQAAHEIVALQSDIWPKTARRWRAVRACQHIDRGAVGRCVEDEVARAGLLDRGDGRRTFQGGARGSAIGARANSPAKLSGIVAKIDSQLRDAFAGGRAGTPKPEPRFATNCTNVRPVSHEPRTNPRQDVRAASIDKMTGVQALERTAPGCRSGRAKVVRREFGSIPTAQAIGSVGESRTQPDYEASLRPLGRPGAGTWSPVTSTGGPRASSHQQHSLAPQRTP